MMPPAIDATVLSKRPPIDTEPAPYVGLSAFLHILFLMIAMVVPPGAAHLELDQISQRDRFVSMARLPEEKPESQEDSTALADDEPDPRGGSEKSAKHSGEEGAAGSPDAAANGRRMAIEGPPDNLDPQIARQRDEQIARTAGIFQASSSLWSGQASETIGAEALDELGRLDGQNIGASSGAFGLGVSDWGRGRDGDEESFGMHDVDTRGWSRDDKEGDGFGRDAGRLDSGDRELQLPEPIPGKPVVYGALDKEIIQRVVRRHRRELAYCYESELQKDASLEGRVVIKFTISGNGSVISAMTKSSTMNNRAVESCLARKIRRWTFPVPQEGGLVTVNYPFRFKKQ